MLTLQGVRHLTRFDPVGFLFFDASRRGFWRSFGSALICLPIWLVTVYQQALTLENEAAISFLIIQITSYIVAWLAYPLLVVKVADIFGLWPNYYRYMVAYNWFQPVMQLLWLPLLLVESIQGKEASELAHLLYVVIQVVQGIYGWFLARFGLGLSPWNALALTFIDLLLGLFIVGITTLI